MTPLLALIGGGSGAGKSTLAGWLRDRLAPVGALVVREDDYYIGDSGDADPRAGSQNFDDIARKDHALLLSHLRSLKAGVAVETPLYDFVAHRRRPETATAAPAPVILVEGTHVLYNEALLATADLSVYVDTPDDIRLARRILRDIGERGRETADVIAQYLRWVKPMHYRYTYPGRFRADMVVDASDPRVGDPFALADEELEHPGAPVLHRLRRLLNKRAAGGDGGST
jgi:uridine kinase